MWHFFCGPKNWGEEITSKHKYEHGIENFKRILAFSEKDTCSVSSCIFLRCKNWSWQTVSCSVQAICAVWISKYCRPSTSCQRATIQSIWIQSQIPSPIIGKVTCALHTSHYGCSGRICDDVPDYLFKLSQSLANVNKSNQQTFGGLEMYPPARSQPEHRRTRLPFWLALPSPCLAQNALSFFGMHAAKSATWSRCSASAMPCWCKGCLRITLEKLNSCFNCQRTVSLRPFCTVFSWRSPT